MINKAVEIKTILTSGHQTMAVLPLKLIRPNQALEVEDYIL